MNDLSQQRAFVATPGTSTDLVQVQETILRWRKDPVSFVREALFAEPDICQIEILNALVTSLKISVRSGHGVGKSAVLSWAILWFMTCFYPCKVPCTAPSSHQLFDILWAEVRLWHRRMLPQFQAQFDIKSDKIDLLGGGDSFAVARTARKENPDALQGFHSENLLFIVDEASGVEEVIFEVAKGALSTPNAMILMTGNPTRTTGYFARSHEPDSRFHKIKISCLDSPRVSEEYIQDMKDEYGEDSNVYRYRVLGEFPLSDDDTMIPLDLVLAAVGREIVMEAKARSIWGLDVARYGSDRSCLAKRHGRIVREDPKIWKGLSTMELVGRVKHEWDITTPNDRPSAIYVDVIGLGAGVVDRLIELDLPAIGINVSESPALMLDNVFRMRDELWLAGMRWFESRQVSLVDTKTIEILVHELTTVRKGYTSSGKLRVESKDDMKKRGLRSCDVADAFLLTLAYESSVMTGAAGGHKSDWSKPISRQAVVV